MLQAYQQVVLVIKFGISSFQRISSSLRIHNEEGNNGHKYEKMEKYNNEKIIVTNNEEKIIVRPITNAVLFQSIHQEFWIFTMGWKTI